MPGGTVLQIIGFLLPNGPLPLLPKNGRNDGEACNQHHRIHNGSHLIFSDFEFETMNSSPLHVQTGGSTSNELGNEITGGARQATRSVGSTGERDDA
jgi:hypothetical protein